MCACRIHISLSAHIFEFHNKISQRISSILSFCFVLLFRKKKKRKTVITNIDKKETREREREKRNNTHIQIKRERERKGKINTVTYKDTKVKSNYWIRLILMMERKEMKRQGETKGFQYMLILKFLFESSKS